MLYRVFLLFIFIILYPGCLWAQSGVPFSVDIIAHVPGCGDGVIQSGEQCDGVTMGGASCSTIGFSSGNLSCSTACTYVTDMCVLTSPKPVADGTRKLPSIQDQTTNVVVTGYASPDSMVTLLKDGQAIGVTVSNDQGEFQITIVGLSEGTHLFQVTAETIGSFIATSATFNARVMFGATTKVSGVLVAPVISILKEEDEILKISGRALDKGLVSVDFDGQTTNILLSEDGTFAFSKKRHLESRFITVSLIYQGQNVQQVYYVPFYKNENACSLISDISSDCRVNIIDFTTIVYSYLRQAYKNRFDFNEDGMVDLVDFSIMAFYWTG